MTRIQEVLHQCTFNMYRDFFEQTASQKVVKIALPVIVALAATVYFIARSFRDHATEIAKEKPRRDDRTPPAVQIGFDMATLKGEEIDYSNKEPIPCAVNPNIAYKLPSRSHVANFFNRLKDPTGYISWMGESQKEKMDESAFSELSEQWIDRGGKFFFPQEGNPVVIEKNTLCAPWCLSGRTCSVVLYDLLRRAKHHETLLPGGISKNSSVLNDVSPWNPAIPPAIEAIIGLPIEEIRLNNRLKESAGLQTSLTYHFKQQVKLDKPVKLFVFAEAVPLLMKEIIQKTDNKSLENITLVAFHYFDPTEHQEGFNVSTEDDIRDFQTKVLAQLICFESEARA